jgi:site-specific recombinase XerD
VPISDELLPILEEAVRLKLPQAKLILTSAGRTPTRQHVLAAFKKLQQRLSLREWSFHSLRHFFCSALVRHGANIEAVRTLAGHSKLDVTQRYVHATGADLKAAITRLSGN